MIVEKRRQRIKEIISEKEVNTQGELAKILSSEGYSVTQATVSRDIKELGLVKEKGKVLNYRYALPSASYSFNSQDKVVVLLKSYILSVVSACNLIVVKTLEGHASACGMAIDKFNALGLQKIKADKVNTYKVGGCDEYFECKVLTSYTLKEEDLPQEVKDYAYKTGDYHTLYIAEIL